MIESYKKQKLFILLDIVICGWLSTDNSDNFSISATDRPDYTIFIQKPD